MTNVHAPLIVFDWNGTILADTSACLRAMNAVLEKLNVPKVTRAHYQNHYTMPLVNLYTAMGVSNEVLSRHENEIHPLWHATYEAATLRLRRGAKPMLSAIRQRACKSVILSNYVVNRIEQQAAHFGVRDHFDEIIAFQANDATFRKRGKGDRLKSFLQDNPAPSAMIVGDSEEEIEIGRDLGLATVAITDGMCSTARLRAMKPDFLIGTLAEIPAIAQRVFGQEKRRA